MSLATLVNGADCGPVNPLQSLTKNLENDRGLQQDHFGASRVGSSRGAFRTAQAAPSDIREDAANFFSASQSASPAPPIAPPSFDLTALRSSLPAPSFGSPVTFTPSRPYPDQAPSSSWATDFLTHASSSSAVKLPQAGRSTSPNSASWGQVKHSPFSHVLQPRLPMRMMSQMPHAQMPITPVPQAAPHNLLTNSRIDDRQLDNAFQSLEATSVTPTSERELQAEHSQDVSGPQEADILARTAGLLVQSVDHEKNPKFSNSQFLGLMKQLRDRTAIVEGDDIVAAPLDLPLGNNSPVSVDLKGKSKAVPTSFAVVQGPGISQLSSPLAEEVVPIESQVDENETYFRQDNEDYIQYWKAHHAPVPPVVAPPQEWQELEREWQRFESTTSGVGPLTVYQFQPENPYLLEEWSHNHHMHGGTPQVRSLSENVLQMEAAVQRDPTDARAWFELGVKQQENEREQQAISALKRALELDPTHLASWLALAVSYTNEGDRRRTYQAILNWVRHNGKYRDIVAVFDESNDSSTDVTEEFQKLIDCLIAMARGVSQSGAGSTEIDADVQIALAILLNSNEDYSRSQDCFRAALSVRPDDWLLYNRVGATLANGGRADEALSYYHRALEINPAYIRARFNVGIACINLKRYEEAAQHILDALVLQDSDGLRNPEYEHGVTSIALWDSLKTCCLHMQRIDLAAMCDKQDLEGIRNQLY